MRVLFLVVVGLVLGQFLSFVVAELKAPGTPFGVRLGIGHVMGLVLCVIILKNHRDQGRAFEGVRLGDRQACAALLQKRRASNTAGQMDAFGTAALEISAGEAQAALARLERDTLRLGISARMRAVVEAHAALVSADLAKHAEALASLLDVGGLPHPAVERYRAYLVARAALSPVGADLLSRADKKLAAFKDPEARAYLQWVRAHHEVMPFDAHDRLPDMRRAAELATLQGLPALAAKISSRATALERAATEVGPYRR
jgi:hypothetical protein